MNLGSAKKYGPNRIARKRVGRGKGSGLGKNSTRGHKGQGHHSSGGRHKLGHEGGQMPLFRRLAKRGFSNFRFRTTYTIINVDLLNEFDNGAEVTFEAVSQKGLVSPEGEGLKVLGNGELKKKLTVTAHRFSESAKKKIVAAGGTVNELNPRPEIKVVKKAPKVAAPAAEEPTEEKKS